MVEYHIFRNGALRHIFHAWNLVHNLLHDFFNDGTKSPGTGIPFDSLFGDGMDGLLIKFQVHMVHGQQFLVLLDQCILWFRQDFDQCIFIEWMKGNDNRQAADEFRNQAVFQEDPPAVPAAAVPPCPFHLSFQCPRQIP